MTVFVCVVRNKFFSCDNTNTMDSITNEGSNNVTTNVTFGIANGIANSILRNMTQGNSSCVVESVYFVAVPSAGDADDIVVTITAAIAIPLFMVAMIFGYMLFQFFVGIAAGVAAGVSVIYALSQVEVSCDLVSWSAPAAAVVAFGLGVCIARRAGCLLGVLIGGAVPYLIFTLFPSIAVIDTGTTPNVKFLGFYLLPVWATVGGSALLFGVLLFRYMKLIRIIATAGIGAYGVVAGICLLIIPPENWIFAVAVGMSFIVSVVMQYFVTVYRKRGSLGPWCDAASKEG